MFTISNSNTTLKVQVRNSSVLMYYPQEPNTGNHSTLKNNLNNSETYKGEVTIHTKKRIEKAVNLFLQISPVTWLYNPITNTKHQFQLSFITLTVSNNERVIEHDFAYKHLLKPFLTWLRDTKKITTYIWKAEVQIRGQIHYHITLNQFLHLSEIKEKWNYLQNKAKLLNHFNKNNQHTNPNSIDVHSVIKIKSIEAYLCKYLSKHLNKGSEIYNHTCKEKPLIKEIVYGNMLSCTQANYFEDYTVNGKVWDCSTNIKGKKYFTIDATKNTYKNLFTHLNKNEFRQYTNDFCMIISSNPNMKQDLLYGYEHTLYNDWLQWLKREIVTKETKRKSNHKKTLPCSKQTLLLQR